MSAPEPVDYAVPRDAEPRASSPWPLIALVFLALGLIFLGGCFCAGLLLLNVPALLSPQMANYPLSSGQTILALLLGILALACFVPGFVLAIILMRRLLTRV